MLFSGMQSLQRAAPKAKASVPALLFVRCHSGLARLPLLHASHGHCHNNPISQRSRKQSSSTQDQQVEAVEAAVNNLLYNTVKKGHASRHVLTALVNNEPGVLSRISGVLAARGFNIDSLVVGETEMPQLSRTTLVLHAGEDVEQVKKQLEDIVQVWAVVLYEPGHSIIERELILIKVSCVPNNTAIHPFYMGDMSTEDVGGAATTRGHIVELTKLFGGKVLDVTHDSVCVELTAKARRVDAFLALMKPFGIKECARTGVVAMLRGAMSGFEEEEPVDGAADGPDMTMLPPG